MSKIEELTPEQKDLFPKFMDKWLTIGLETKPADRPRAEAGIRLAYQAINMGPPKDIIWCLSPMAMAKKRAELGLTDLDTIRPGAWNKIRSNVWNSIEYNLSINIFDNVQPNVYDKIGVKVWTGVLFIEGYDPGECDPGQHGADGLAFYDYMREVGRLVTETEPLVGHLEIAQSAGWWETYENVCLISERPHTIKLDDQSRLHSDNGLAVEYPDGWGIAAWHGEVREKENAA